MSQSTLTHSEIASGRNWRSGKLSWQNRSQSATTLTEVTSSELKQAVEAQHGGMATFVQFVPVHEFHMGVLAWNGTVAIFDLAGHPTANRAYAWSYELPDGNRRFFAMLYAPPITAPKDAVRAAIVAQAQTAK